ETVGEFNNRMTYTENIYAGYAIMGNEINRFSYQLGVRGELTDVSVELSRESQTTNQNYFNVFPSSHLAYRIADNMTVQLSYSNNRTLYTGNPNLRPEYTHSIEGGYLFDWESGSILSSVYYRHRSGVINRITVVDSIGYNRIFPVNLSTQDAVGVEFNFNWDPTPWWRFTSNANFYRAVTKGQYEGQVLNADTYTLSARAMSRITFFKKYDFQTSWRYRAPRETTQGRRKSQYSIDLGLSRDILAGRGTVTVSVRDLFNTNKFRDIVDD